MRKKILILSILAISSLSFSKLGWEAKPLINFGVGFKPVSVHPNASVTFYKELESKSKIGFKIGGGVEFGYSHYFHKEETKTEATTTNGSESSTPSTTDTTSTTTTTETTTPTPAPSAMAESSTDTSSTSGTSTETTQESTFKMPNHGYGVGFVSAELFGNVHEDVMLYGGGNIGYNFMFKNADIRSQADNQLYVKGFVGVTFKEYYTAELAYGSTTGLSLGLGARIGF